MQPTRRVCPLLLLLLLLLLLATAEAQAWQDVTLKPGTGPRSMHAHTKAHQQQQHGRRPPHHSVALVELLEEHLQRHQRCLHDLDHAGQYVVVTMDEAFAGLGNRMLPVVTGMLLALMTGRCFFLQHESYLRDFRNAAGLDMDWAPHAVALAARGREVSWATLGPRSWWHMPCTDQLYATANFADLWANATVVNITNDNDYLVPLLMSNAHYGPFIERYFPTREVFHALAAFLFQLAPAHASAAEAFRAASLAPADFVIGIQIRTRKAHGDLRPPPMAAYCSLARALAHKRGLPAGQVRVFVAADSSEALEAVRADLGTDFAVAAVDHGAGRDVFTLANNPGTEEAAVLDMALLAGCDALVITAGSSFGYVAAAWGGIVPVHMLYRAEGAPSLASPFFYRPLNSEPCYWGAYTYYMDQAPEEAVSAFLANPLWMQYAHCV